MNITRPTVTIEHNTNGGSTYTVRTGESTTEYVRIGWAREDTATTRLMKGFTSEYNRLAKDVEDGKIAPYHIMRMMVDHGFFRRRQVMATLKHVI